MSMMQPDSKFAFGKHKGKTARWVCEEDPSYLYWLKQTGFSDFGKELTEFIFAWEEANPREARKVDHNIAKKKATDAARGVPEDSKFEKTGAPTYTPPPPVERRAHAEWGSW